MCIRDSREGDLAGHADVLGDGLVAYE